MFWGGLVKAQIQLRCYDMSAVKRLFEKSVAVETQLLSRATKLIFRFRTITFSHNANLV